MRTDFVMTDTFKDADGFQDRVRGSIFGQAIGDALGHPVEFSKGLHVSGLLDDNKFTDDTQMFCAIGEALLEANPEQSEDKFMEVLSKHFVEWRKNPLGGSHRAPGGTCMEAVRKLGAGRHWRQAGATAVGKGNGSAMRAGIVGARFWKNPAYAFRIGCLTSVNTHNNLESILAAGMVAYLVAASIKGDSWEACVADGLVLCAEFESRVPDYPTNSVPLNNTRDGQSPWKAVAQFGRGFALGVGDFTNPEGFQAEMETDFTAVPAVAESIYYNSRTEYFDTMALEAANHADDSDTIAAITGTIGGARFGYSEIPEEWAAKIELREYLDKLASRIWEASKDAEEVAEAAEELVIDIDEMGIEEGAAEYVAEVADNLEDKDFEVEF